MTKGKARIKKYLVYELGGKSIKDFCVLRTKTYAYLTDDGCDHKNSKGTEKCVIKQKLIFKNYQYQYLMIIREKVDLKRFNGPKAFIEYSNDMRDVYKNIDEYSLDKERNILIVFDDMTADIIKNKKLNSIVTELFMRIRKLNISLVFITQSYFKVLKDVRLNTIILLFQKFQIEEKFNKLK